jgi:hypothetical protein
MEGELMAREKKRMRMEEAIAILRQAGWTVNVDEANKRIVLQEPLPDVSWLHNASSRAGLR